MIDMIFSDDEEIENETQLYFFQHKEKMNIGDKFSCQEQNEEVDDKFLNLFSRYHIVNDLSLNFCKCD